MCRSDCLRNGAHGQDRTADTGIFNVGIFNHLLIVLAQAVCGPAWLGAETVVCSTIATAIYAVFLEQFAERASLLARSLRGE